MPLAPKISKVEYDALGDSVKGAYAVIDGTTDYKLDVAGFVVDQDPAALLNAKNHEKEARQKAEAELAKIKKEKEDADREAEDKRLRQKGEHEELEKRFKERSDKERAELEAKINKQNEVMGRSMIEAKATTLAAEISGENAHLMLPFIKQRLAVNFEDGEPKLTVLDAAGKASLDNLEDLRKSLVADKQFAPIIVQSKANGGSSGAGGRSTGGGDSSKKFSDLNGTELKELREKNPTEYDRLKNASGPRPNF